MQPQFFGVFLSILCLSSPVSCTFVPTETGQDAERSHRSGKSANAITIKTQKLSGREARHLNLIHFNAPLKHTLNKDSLNILPERKRTSDFVSIFDVKIQQFLRFSRHGELLRSKKMANRKECPFHRLHLDLKNHRMYHSSSSGLSLSFQDPDIYARGQENLSQSLSGLLSRLRHTPLVNRKRRSHHPHLQVNPSDPLRSENHRPGHAVNDRKHMESDQVHQGQEQSGAVSKETITSFDDPLQVLHSKVPVSPVKTNIAEMTEKE